MTLIIDAIITPYIVKKYNAINEKLDGQLMIYFLSKTDINRDWNEFPNIQFKYEFLNDHPLRITGKDVNTFHINLDIVKKLRYLNPDHIIVCGWDSFAFYYALHWAKKKKIRFTLWSGSTEYEKSWRRTITKPMVKWMIRNSNDFIAYGTRAKDYLVKLGADSKKIQIFYNTVDVDYFEKQCAIFKPLKEEFKIKLGIRTSKIILFSGRLLEMKGIFEMVEGFEEYFRQNNDVSLLIMGSGPDEGRLKEFIKARRIKNIIFTKFIQYNELYKYYAISDLLLFPTRQDIWGLVVNEAMACDLPIIITNVAGASADLIEEEKNGYIIKLNSPKEITVSIKKIFENNLHKQNNSNKLVQKTKIENILEEFKL